MLQSTCLITIAIGGTILFKVEEKIIEKIKKNYILVFAVAITLIAILIRLSALGFKAGDYNCFLKGWYEDLKAKGGLSGLATYKGNYNAPYMTIMALLTYLPINSLYAIKAVSIFFDFTLAISVAYLVTLLVKNNKKMYALIAYTLVLCMPQVIANGALWGQSDSIYATFTILAIVMLIKEKYTKSFIFLGLAFAFKLQFIFILPVFVILYVCQNKFSILNFLIIPLVDFILCLPAIILGRPIKSVWEVYFGQAGCYDSLSMSFPNLYSIFPLKMKQAKYISRVGILLTITVLAILMLWCLYKKITWNKDNIIKISLLVLVIVTYLLPGMHERYLYVGEVLSIVYYLVYRKNLWFVIIVNLNAIISYELYLSLYDINVIIFSVMAVIYGLAIIYFVMNVVKDIKKCEATTNTNIAIAKEKEK